MGNQVYAALISDDVVTKEVNFRGHGDDNERPLLRINPGVPVADACSTAHCIDDAIRRVLEEAVINDEPISVNVAWLCSFASEAAAAMRQAAEMEV